MQLGFVSAILPELTLDETLAFAAAEGFSTIEAMCWPTGRAERRFAGVTHIDAAEMTPTRADDLAKNFVTPPASARPWVYTFCDNGNLTRKGITADLEAMQ